LQAKEIQTLQLRLLKLLNLWKISVKPRRK